jgi:hypothetical protein
MGYKLVPMYATASHVGTDVIGPISMTQRSEGINYVAFKTIGRL